MTQKNINSGGAEDGLVGGGGGRLSLQLPFPLQVPLQFPAVGKKQKQNLVVQLRMFKCGETQRSSLTAHIIKAELICSALVAPVKWIISWQADW